MKYIITETIGKTETIIYSSNDRKDASEKYAFLYESDTVIKYYIGKHLLFQNRLTDEELEKYKTK